MEKPDNCCAMNHALRAYTARPTVIHGAHDQQANTPVGHGETIGNVVYPGVHFEEAAIGAGRNTCPFGNELVHLYNRGDPSLRLRDAQRLGQISVGVGIYDQHRPALLSTNVGQ